MDPHWQQVFDLVGPKGLLEGWQCHGLGLAKRYLTPNLRIHVWDQRFRHPGRWEESIHSHRWGLSSRVLCGSLVQEQVIPTLDPDGDYLEWEVSNQSSENPLGLTLKADLRFRVEIQRVVVPASAVYSMDRGEFHRSDAEDGTITLMERIGVSGNSSCLIPVGSTPKHGHDWTNLPDVRSIVEQHLVAAGAL